MIVEDITKTLQTMPTLSKEIIAAAIDGFEAQKRRIDIQISELRAMLSGSPAKVPHTAKAKRKVSADTLRRMREGQQRRWAQVKVADAPSADGKPKRMLSAAGKANIVAALKKRWAAKKSATGAQPAPAPKKAARKKTS